jgi:hypothetical protein
MGGLIKYMQGIDYTERYLIVQGNPPRFFVTPSAVRINFTANYPLDTCKELLTRAEVTPSRWSTFWGASYLKFRFSTVDADLCTFEAKRRVRKTVIKARGYVQKIDEDSTSVVGYADTKISFYVVMLISMLISLGVSMFIAGHIYNGSSDSILVAGVLLIAFATVTSINLVIIRRDVKALARIIEETLQ